MNHRSQLENWLAAAALPPELPRTLDEGGFWSMSSGSVTLSLAVPSDDGGEKEQFFLYVPVLNTAGAEDRILARFYRVLLEIQLSGQLPAGLSFGMNDEDDLVVLVGSYPFRTMNAPLFDELLHLALDSAVRLHYQLDEYFTRLTEQQNEEKQPENIALRQSDASVLSDSDLLSMQKMHFMQA